MAWDGEVNTTAVDGVPVLWAEAPGPLRASLMFRVGHADEKLPWSGITHLVEHLTLFALGPKQSYEFNGAVTPNRTMFVAAGTPADIVGFLGHVTSTLANLPLDRADTEKTVLLAEATSRSMSASDVMFNLRFGARGCGLYRYKEFGLYHVPNPWISAWSARYFTRDNAVLWLSGPPPADLRLPLPAGQRMPDTGVQPLPLTLPAYAQGPVGGAGVSMVAPRSTALAMATSVAAARLLQRLRYDKGIAYSVQGGYMPLDSTHAQVSHWTDAQHGHAATVLNDTVHSMYAMSTEGPSAEELAQEVQTFSRNLERDEAPVGWLDRTAVRLLNGEPVQRPSDLVADMQTVTPAAARDAMAAALRSAIYLGPDDVPAPGGIHAYVKPAVDPVRGQVLPHVQAKQWRNAPYLAYSGDGVTLSINADERITVRFDACEAVLRYGDGGICLVGSDGSILPINPTEWVQAPLAAQQIAQVLSPQLNVPLPAEQTALAIKVPAQAQRGASPLAGISLERWIGLFVFVAVGVGLLVFAFVASSRVGAGPSVISLLLWGAVGFRLLRRLL